MTISETEAMESESGRTCSACGERKGAGLFSKKQWLAKAHRSLHRRSSRDCTSDQPVSMCDGSSHQSLSMCDSRRCKSCVDKTADTGDTAAATPVTKALGKSQGGTSDGQVLRAGKSKSSKLSAGTGGSAGSGVSARTAVVDRMDANAKQRLQSMMDGAGEASGVQGEEDPFVCDITGCLISTVSDGRYHFNDGRGPEDPAAVCMAVSAYASFETLHMEHPETWEPAYADKSKWEFIPAGSNY